MPQRQVNSVTSKGLVGGKSTEKLTQVGLGEKTFNKQSTCSLLLAAGKWPLSSWNILADRSALVCLGLWPLDSLTK